MSTVSTGLSLRELAEVKKLPIEFLVSLGVSDFKYFGQPSVKISYFSPDGQGLAVRYRLALAGDNRFKWRKGDRPIPYGLNRLEQIKKSGWALIVEGESDCWTCWFHGIPALGAPGKGIWPTAWGDYLKGLDVYAWQEPEAEDFVLRVLKSNSGLRYIPAPQGIKDISEAHIQGADVPALLRELRDKSESAQALSDKVRSEQSAQLYTEARRVIEAEDPLELIKDAIRGLGYGGDIKPALICYLAATSRLLAMRGGSMPVHLLLTGPSSSGKSYTLAVIKKLLPDSSHYTVDAGSPKIIIYNEEPLEHRVLIFGEADSLPAGEDSSTASAIRNLLQDHRLHYEVTIRDANTGDFTTRKVDKPGPTVLITTSTRTLGEQLMTRMFSLEVSDSKEQISAALRAQAELELHGTQPVDGALIAFQAYLQLKAPIKVRWPSTGALAEAMGKMGLGPRALRDHARITNFVKSVAIIRHHQRQTDNEGWLVATMDDYLLVRGLVNDIFVDSATGATSEIRKLAEAVGRFDTTNGKQITSTALAKALDLGRKQVTRRANKAIKQGWLVNNEQRKSHPANYALGEPMPETEGLPLLSVDIVDAVDNERVHDFMHENTGVDGWTPLTVSTISPPTDLVKITHGEEL